MQCSFWSNKRNTNTWYQNTKNNQHKRPTKTLRSPIDGLHHVCTAPEGRNALEHVPHKVCLAPGSCLSPGFWEVQNQRARVGIEQGLQILHGDLIGPYKSNHSNPSNLFESSTIIIHYLSVYHIVDIWEYENKTATPTSQLPFFTAPHWRSKMESLLGFPAYMDMEW